MKVSHGELLLIINLKYGLEPLFPGRQCGIIGTWNHVTYLGSGVNDPVVEPTLLFADYLTLARSLDLSFYFLICETGSQKG